MMTTAINILATFLLVLSWLSRFLLAEFTEVTIVLCSSNWFPLCDRPTNLIALVVLLLKNVTLDAVGSSRVGLENQKLYRTFNLYTECVIDFTKCSKPAKKSEIIKKVPDHEEGKTRLKRLHLRLHHWQWYNLVDPSDILTVCAVVIIQKDTKWASDHRLSKFDKSVVVNLKPFLIFLVIIPDTFWCREYWS